MLDRRYDPEVHHRDLESKASNTWLFGRTLVCGHGDSRPRAILSMLKQEVRGSPIKSSVKEQEVPTKLLPLYKDLRHISVPRISRALALQVCNQVSGTQECLTSSCDSQAVLKDPEALSRLGLLHLPNTGRISPRFLHRRDAVREISLSRSML